MFGPGQSPQHMTKKGRQKKILSFIENRGQASVSDLCEYFRVSKMTVRRDLYELDKQGYIIRVHGGAVSSNYLQSLTKLPVMKRMEEEASAKRKIGEAVASMVEQGETIFIGAGTTTFAVAEALKNCQGITVVTNALTVANSLAGSVNVQVLVVGGFLQLSNFSLIGHITRYALKDLHVGKVITGTHGIHPTHGLTSDNLLMMETDRDIMGLGENIIVVADHTKFGHVASSRTAPVTAASLIVTDEQAPENILTEIRNLGVEIIKV